MRGPFVEFRILNIGATREELDNDTGDASDVGRVGKSDQLKA